MKSVVIGWQVYEGGNHIGNGYQSSKGYYDNIAVIPLEGCNVEEVESVEEEESSYHTSCPHEGSRSVDSVRIFYSTEAILKVAEDANVAYVAFAIADRPWQIARWNEEKGWDSSFLEMIL